MKTYTYKQIAAARRGDFENDDRFVQISSDVAATLAHDLRIVAERYEADAAIIAEQMDLPAQTKDAIARTFKVQAERARAHADIIDA